MHGVPTALLLLVLGGVVACSEVPEGEFLALTYNVAGLPEGLSKSDPVRNTPLISPKLNAYDLVLVQEDFTYHDLLIAAVDHPHRSTTKVPEARLTGDGLNRLSRSPFSEFARHQWRTCFGGLDSGSDCLAEKGLSVATHTLLEGIQIDIYNLHMDAGGGDEDRAARADQAEQLLEVMAVRSAGRAVIVAGDTNLRPSRDGDAQILERVRSGAELTDACTAISCSDPDRIDRFLFRSTPEVTVEVLGWSEETSFVDDAGGALSDHSAIAVRFGYRGG
jgi:hypothetical protein